MERMMERNKKHTALWNVARRECRRLVSRPLYLFCMVIAPLFCYIFFTTLMDSGLPTDMPVGVVDQDMSATSRQLIRNLDAFEQTAVVARYPTINEARTAMQRFTVSSTFPKVPLPKRRPDGSPNSLSIQTIPCSSQVHSSSRT